MMPFLLLLLLRDVRQSRDGPGPVRHGKATPGWRASRDASPDARLDVRLLRVPSSGAWQTVHSPVLHTGGSCPPLRTTPRRSCVGTSQHAPPHGHTAVHVSRPTRAFMVRALTRRGPSAPRPAPPFPGAPHRVCLPWPGRAVPHLSREIPPPARSRPQSAQAHSDFVLSHPVGSARALVYEGGGDCVWNHGVPSLRIRSLVCTLTTAARHGDSHARRRRRPTDGE